MSAIYHDQTLLYLSPEEPKTGEQTSIKLRIPKPLKHTNINVFFNNQELNKNSKMKFNNEDTFFCYYVREFFMLDVILGYHFEITKENGDIVYFDALGEIHNRKIEDFVLVSDLNTPKWSYGSVYYQIFVDRFNNGDKANDVKEKEYIYHKTHIVVKGWDELPTTEAGYKEFFNGDLLGVKNKLGYLKKLGIETLLFNPIFLSASVHKYDTQSYEYVDPHYGVIIDNKGYKEIVTSKKNLEASNVLFYDFVEEAHLNNIRVILDGVFNHIGSTHFWCDEFKLYGNKGVFHKDDSLYKNNFCYEHGHYQRWHGHKSLPKLNYDSKKVWNYIIKIGKKWIFEFNVDGWRLDVAEDLGNNREQNIAFWKDFDKETKKVNKNSIVFAEMYNTPLEHVKQKAWDGIMNYSGCMSPVSEFLTGMDNHSEYRKDDLLNNSCSFVNTVKWSLSQLPMNSKFLSLTQLSNHDHSRWMTRTNRKTGRLSNLGYKAAEEGINIDVFKMGMIMLFSLPGSPGLYYGDEIGLCGWHDPDNRRPMRWERLTEENLNILKFTKNLIKFYKKNSALRKGCFTFLDYDCGYVSYAVWNKENKCLICINNEDNDKSIEIPVWEIGITSELPVDRFSNKSINVSDVVVENGIFKTTLVKKSAIVFKF